MAYIIALFALLGAALAGGGSGGATRSPEPPMDDAPDMVPMEDTDDAPGDMGDHDGHDMPPASGTFADITSFGMFHGSSSHTTGHSLAGGRTAITTEALLTYNGLRDFLGLDPVDLETIGAWAFENTLTNNEVPYGEDLKGVGLFYGLQGAKVGWIRDDAFDPQILADIQLAARQDDVETVMEMVEESGLNGFASYLENEDQVETFINTLKMEPHYGGWMHGRTHGWLDFQDETGANVAIAHDLNHLTVLSHDQTQPFMNDTFDWPQWPALEMPQADVANYFQSMVTLGDPKGEGISTRDTASAVPDWASLLDVLALEPVEESLPDMRFDEDDALAIL